MLFRSLVKHRPDLIDKTPPNLPNDKLDLELYKHDRTYKAQLRAKSTKEWAKPRRAPKRQKFEGFMEPETGLESTTSSLGM